MLTAPGGGPATNGEYSVWAEFRNVITGTNGTAYQYSNPSTSAATITLNASGPMSYLNSPAGILDPVSDPSLTLVQPQYVNSDLPQWVTYSGWSTDNPAETVTFGIAGCTPCSSPPLASGLTAFLWEWPASQPGEPPSYTYLQVTATDQAGNQASTSPPSGYDGTHPVLKIYSATTAPQEVDCQPFGGALGNTPVACTVLADDQPQSYEIPGDPPSVQVNQYEACTTGDDIAFSGYADPSMRRDPVVTSTNPYGTNLWMLYSYPEYWATYTTIDTCPTRGGDLYHTPAVETHIAESATSGSSPLPGGTDWQAYCASQSCTIGTPVWPSEPFCSSPIYSVSQGQSTEVTCTFSCAATAGSVCFSSHEVPNFWPDGAGNWYAAHLMYYVELGMDITTLTINDGCLVLSTATGAPTALGWPYLQGPAKCGDAFPSGNAALTWSQLNTAVSGNPGTPCFTWGEPAVMVSNGTAYLALSCLNGDGAGIGYYFFSNSQSTFLTAADWKYLAGPFSSSDPALANAYPPSTPPPGPSQNQQVDSLTELDWAMRADGSGNDMVAIVTLAYVVDPGLDPQGGPIAYQYGCAAVSFNLQNLLGQSPTDPFGSVLATVTDLDGSANSPPWEQQGPSGCTYDPTSNTGIVIVRHLINGSQYALYSLLDTGVLP
jgi:hypothetical protein